MKDSQAYALAYARVGEIAPRSQSGCRPSVRFSAHAGIPRRTHPFTRPPARRAAPRRATPRTCEV